MKNKITLIILLLFVVLSGCSNSNVGAITTKSSTTNDNMNNTTNTTEKLTVHFIDVGQADSILIQQNNETMLIDAGNNSDDKTVVEYIKKQGIKKLDYIIGTHPHEDHIGGLDTVIKTFDIGVIIMPKASTTTQTYLDVLKAVKAKKLIIKTPILSSFEVGTAICTILAPNNEKYDDLNNYSIVTKLKFGETSFLFTGDAEGISEKEMLDKKNDLKSTVLKVGHHGSNSSTTEEFLKAVSPQYAVISVGKDNDYGHPANETIDKLTKAKINIFRTDEQGTIVASSDGKKVTFDRKTSSTDTVNVDTNTTSNIVIEAVSLSQEYITIKNNSDKDVSLKGWKIVSTVGNQTYNFPDSFNLKAGKSVKVTSGSKATEDGTNTLKWVKSDIWNNKGDTGELYDVNGKLISTMKGK